MCYVSGSTSTPSEINIELHISLTWRFTKGNREGGSLNLVPSSFTDIVRADSSKLPLDLIAFRFMHVKRPCATAMHAMPQNHST